MYLIWFNYNYDIKWYFINLIEKSKKNHYDLFAKYDMFQFTR